MSTVKESATTAQSERPRRPSRATVAGTIALVTWPLFGAGAGIAEHLAVGDTDGSTDTAGLLEAVSANPGLWNVYSVFLLAMAVATLAWVPAVWRLAVQRSPRWAWTAAVAGTLFAMGQMVHLMSWNVLTAGFAAASTPTEATVLMAAIDSQWFFFLIFIPFLLGTLVAAPIAAIALRRARLLPIWSVLVIVAASVAVFFVGTDSLIGVGVHTLLLITGFAPVLVRIRGGER
jgi:hypothetical protein